MVRSSRKWPATLMLAGGLMLAPGCAPLDGLAGDIGGRNSYLDGEVRSVDARRGRLEVREQHGRNQTVRIDNRTQVVHRQRQYPVSALERGDLVRVRLSHDRNGTPWADRVEVRQNVRDRGTVAGRTERLDGTVRSVDGRGNRFTLERNRAQNVTVYLPRNARREDIRRFERLRRGERVRVDVRHVGRNQAELVRFR